MRHGGAILTAIRRASSRVEALHPSARVNARIALSSDRIDDLKSVSRVQIRRMPCSRMRIAVCASCSRFPSRCGNSRMISPATSTCRWVGTRMARPGEPRSAVAIWLYGKHRHWWSDPVIDHSQRDVIGKRLERRDVDHLGRIGERRSPQEPQRASCRSRLARRSRYGGRP